MSNEQLTDQTAFDLMVQHCFDQGFRAEAQDGTCQYRMDNGARCAVGCLIPDDAYTPQFEGQSAGQIHMFVHTIAELDTEMLEEMQQTHDFLLPLATTPRALAAERMKTFLSRAIRIAADYNLSNAVPQRLLASLNGGAE